MSRYALGLDGYEDYSVWGYDEAGATYFAQLWRNESNGDGQPDSAINWFTRRAAISSPTMLATLIAGRTSRSDAAVLRAMGAAATAPESPGLLRLADELTRAEPGAPRC